MRTRSLSLSLLILLASVDAASTAAPIDEQEPKAATADEELIVTPVQHGSLMLQYGDRVIHIDPWSRGDYELLPTADILLITDIHPDHLDIEMASQLMDHETVVIGPEAVADEWGGVDVVLNNGETTTVGDIFIEAVPMYNIERGPGPGRLYHDKGRGNGYVITVGGKRVYVSGDTECVQEMRDLENIDIAFVCMNLPYTMTPGEAAECVKAFRPEVVYPYHYRGSDLDVFTFGLEDAPEIEVRALDWYRR